MSNAKENALKGAGIA